MRLRSDYQDYFDHCFDGSWTDSEIFYRFAKTQKLRRTDHDELADVGFRVPPRGQVSALYMAGEPQHAPKQLVVYVNESMHRGEGKILADAAFAFEAYPDHYATVYLPQRYPVSYRLLLVGKLAFWLRYQSRDDIWRSNVGEVAVTEPPRGPPGTTDDTIDLVTAALRLGHPLVAIDFVEWHELLWAIDLNTAPQIKGTPIEKKLSPMGVYGAILDRVETLRNQRA